MAFLHENLAVACDWIEVDDLNACQETASSSVNTFTAGSIPTQVGMLTKLISITVQSTGKEGTLPSELGMLTKLTSLTLHNAEMIGSIPAEFGLLTELTRLWLSF